MKNTIYREKLIHRYKNPKNYGTMGGFDKKSFSHNPYCGDEIEVFVKIENKKISDIKWIGEGCVISQVATSWLVGRLKNKKVEHISNITKEDVLDMFNCRINLAREKCALLSLKVIKKLLNAGN